MGMEALITDDASNPNGKHGINIHQVFKTG